MHAIKKTISIDKAIADEASTLSPNFSATVEAALVEYIQHQRVKNAIESFGKWDDRKKSSAEMVKELRQQDDREYVTRNDPNKKKRKKE